MSVLYSTTFQSQPINPANRTEHIGFPATRGGAVVYDIPFTRFEVTGAPYPTIPEGAKDALFPQEVCKFIETQAAGIVVVELFDSIVSNPNILVFFAQPGIPKACMGRRVLSTFTAKVNGADVVYTTTVAAANIFWYGGI